MMGYLVQNIIILLQNDGSGPYKTQSQIIQVRIDHMVKKITFCHRFILKKKILQKSSIIEKQEAKSTVRAK